MSKFKLLKDWYIDIPFTNRKEKIFDKGHTFIPNVEGKYIIKYKVDNEESTITGDYDYFKSNNTFEEIKSDFELIIEEVSDDDDIQIKNWRIQLDVQTTRKKLNDIKKTLNRELKKIIIWKKNLDKLNLKL